MTPNPEYRPAIGWTLLAVLAIFAGVMLSLFWLAMWGLER